MQKMLEKWSLCILSTHYSKSTYFVQNEEKKHRKSLCTVTYFRTLFEIFVFCPKIQLWFPEKIVEFLGWKTRENVVVLDFLAVDNFDFTRKIVKTIWVKNSWKYQNSIFGQKLVWDTN